MKYVYRFLQFTLIIMASMFVYQGHLIGLGLFPLLFIECIFKNWVKNQVTFLVIFLFLVQTLAFFAFFFGTSSIEETSKHSFHNMIKISDRLVRNTVSAPLPVQRHPVEDISSLHPQQPVKVDVQSRQLKYVDYSAVELFLVNCTDFSEQHYDATIGLPQMKPAVLSILTATIGPLPISQSPDLRYRPPAEVRSRLSSVFQQLPDNGYLPSFLNPCWYADPISMEQATQRSNDRHAHHRKKKHFPNYELDETPAPPPGFTCLPFVYILGQPKCGTTDLFKRLDAHPDVYGPLKKEVRGA